MLVSHKLTFQSTCLLGTKSTLLVGSCYHRGTTSQIKSKQPLNDGEYVVTIVHENRSSNCKVVTKKNMVATTEWT